MSSIPSKIISAMHRDDKNAQISHGDYEDALDVYRKWTKALIGGAPDHPDIAMGITHDVVCELPYCGTLVSIYQFNLAVGYVPDDIRQFLRGDSDSKLGACLMRLDHCLGKCTITPVIASALADLRESIVYGDQQQHGFMRSVNRFISENTEHLTVSWSKMQHKA